MKRVGLGPAGPSFPDSSRGGKPRRLRPRGVGTALVLVAFIVLPSALLGFLSWRAIENERSYALERLRDSYRQFAGLAARQIDDQLRDVESQWSAEIEEVVRWAGPWPLTEELARRTGKKPLIAGYFLLTVPGRAVYPPVALSDEALERGAASETRVREHETFSSMVARGEELEYRARDLEGAISAYREVVSSVSSPRLRAMAESYIGRAQLKNGERTAALGTFSGILEKYPEARDLNRMYLRFLAQYQIAVALEGMGRERAALEALLELNRDLLRRSDAINTTQYSYYSDMIQTMSARLLSDPGLRERPRYSAAFQALAEQSKKRISQRYFIQLLQAELNDQVIRRRHFSPRIQYMSAQAEGDPFLLAYRPLPDAAGVYVSGILAVQIDLAQLRKVLLPTVLRNLQPDAVAAIAILGSEEDVVIGTEGAVGAPIAGQDLSPPFDFWEVAVYLRDVPGAIRRLDIRITVWLWLISLLLVSILLGAYVFIRRVRREAYLARAQTTFVNNVTHELRTPLSSIRMFAELLEMRMAEATAETLPEFKGNAGQYLEIIRRESDRLSRLIERVLDFSRMERRVKRYHFEYYDLGETVSHVVESFRPFAESNHFSLELAVGKSLPGVKLDADAFSQVMVNLLSNAVQYSEDIKEIRVDVRRDADGVAVEVSDRGIGIDRAKIPKIFERFYTSRRRMDSRPQGGLGLGLALAREIVHAHNGEIHVTSEVGKGSTFTVWLPASAIEVVAPAEADDDVSGLGRPVERQG